MLKPQSQIIIEELEKSGKVSRNFALSKRITRLGAIINTLINEGWTFESKPTKSGNQMRGKFIKTKYGEDYWYFLISKPKTKK
jgi:hypothetical protein